MTKSEMLANIAVGTGTAEIMSNIYDDVETLKTQVAALETQVTGLQWQTLAEGTDLNTLSVGRYIIPDATVCATLTNKPITNNWTGIVEVFPCGAAGQLIMQYRPISKDFESYYQRAYYSGSWGDWKVVSLKFTDWTDLPLASGISAYSETQKPRYMRTNKTVFLSGVITGLIEHDTAIATLPSGFRPAKKVIVPIASVGQIISRMSIDTDGTVSYNRSTIEPIIAANWHSIACCFEAN